MAGLRPRPPAERRVRAADSVYRVATRGRRGRVEGLNFHPPRPGDVAHHLRAWPCLPLGPPVGAPGTRGGPAPRVGRWRPAPPPVPSLWT